MRMYAVIVAKDKTMETIKTQARVGKDGVLKLEVPLDLKNVDLEVLIVVQPIHEVEEDQDEWLAFLERTASSLSTNPIKRHAPRIR